LFSVTTAIAALNALRSREVALAGEARNRSDGRQGDRLLKGREAAPRSDGDNWSATSVLLQYFDDIYDVLAKLAQRHVKALFQDAQQYADRLLDISDPDMRREESDAIRRAQLIRVCKAHRK
jgi:hypothetical protein